MTRRYLHTVFAFLVVAAGTSATAQSAPTPSYVRFDTGPVLPVLSGGGPGSWDEIVREKVWVLHQNGLYKMWYVGHTASGGQPTSNIGYATSLDGVSWVKFAGNPVVDRATQDQDVCVVVAQDGTYQMYVEVNDGSIDLLTSQDGVSWTPYAGNPVKRVAASPVVWREGASWFMLYEDMQGPIYDINLATSSDGKTWQDSPANPVLAEATSTVPDSIVKDGSTYHLYYHVNELGGWPAWHATSGDLTNWTLRSRIFRNFSSQATFAIGGEILSYLWNLGGDGKYYLRYGLIPASPTIWHLDDRLGDIASDSSGSHADGLLVNGPLWTTGAIGGALAFDGLDDHVVINYPNLSAWTVSAWVSSPAAPSSAAASGPVHRGSNFQINWNHPNSAFRGAAAVSVGGQWYSASFGPLAANTWYNLTATYDGETLSAYRDGLLITSNSAPSGPPDSETAPLELGRHVGAAQYFRGTVDEVAIYGRALDPAEVAAIVAPVSALTVSPSSVPGGQSSTGTLTLLSPAPAGGLSVALTSDNPAALVPASVTVPAGATTVSFTVVTAPVTVTTFATITASYGDSLSCVLTIRAPELNALSLTPSLVVGGQTSSGTVTLSSPAPAGGMTIALSSSDPAAVVPASVTIPAGGTMASFTIGTVPVVGSTLATITATLGTISRSATLTIEPPDLSSLRLAPSSIVGGTTSTGTVTLTGPAPAGGVVVMLTSNSPYASVPSTLVIASGASRGDFTVTTSPVRSNTHATISATYGSTTRTARLALKVAR